MTDDRQKKLREQVVICNIHANRIQIGLKHVEPLLPLNKAMVDHLSDEQLGFLELIGSRLGKLQDAMGKHVFSLTLDLLGEWNERQSMIDCLNRLEKLAFIEKADFWQYLRQVRNELTHEYENNAIEQIEKIQHAVDAAKALLLVWERFVQVAKQSAVLSTCFVL